MSFQRKLERKKQKDIYKYKNRKVQKKNRKTFSESWSDYQEKKYGKDKYKKILISNKK